MEALVLLGGFAAFGVFGCFLMSKLDNWLGALQNSEESFDQARSIRIATSQPDSIPGITAAWKELRVQYPEFRCTLLLGQEPEVAGALACGRVDLAIVSDHIAMSSAQYQDITLDTQPISILDGMVDVRTMEPAPTYHRLLWNGGRADPYLLELIRRLCRQPQPNCAIIGPNGGRSSHGSERITANS